MSTGPDARPPRPTDHAFAHSRGVFGTKWHLVVDFRGVPALGRRRGGLGPRIDVAGAGPAGRRRDLLWLSESRRLPTRIENRAVDFLALAKRP